MRSSHVGFHILALMLAAAASGPARATPAAALTAEVMPLAASRSVMLGFTESNARAIAVGERGHILVSESRTDWRQIAGVPTRTTLTAASAVGDRVWVVGHDGIILHSADGGLQWTIQREDIRQPFAGDEFAELPDPREGAPLLDVLFLDADNGFAIGAYALMLRTRDGGANWEQVTVTTVSAAVDDATASAADAGEDGAEDNWIFDQDDLALDAETDPHLNGITRTPDGLLFMVAERGTGFRSRDDGETWERIQLPYDGSMFGVLALGEGHLLTYGLRGNVLETRNGGDDWDEVDTGTELSLMGGTLLPDGGLVIVGANGVVLHRAASGQPLQRSTFVNENQETPVLSSVLPRGTRELLVAGERGIGRLVLNAMEATP
jgi:photosystem II stability/assembly factor-like uncharacterized protein